MNEFHMIFIINSSHAKIVLYVFIISLKFWNDNSTFLLTLVLYP
jgi:hypothetical protein